MSDAQPEAGGPMFGLKKSESELLVFIKTHQDAIFSAVLSTIAGDRLAYHVTENTQFKLSPDFTKVQIGERAPELEGNQSTNDSGAIRAAE